MLCCISVEESANPEIPVPKEKGTVRGEICKLFIINVLIVIVSGVIIRGGKTPNTCTVMNVVHLDLKVIFIEES